jgi:hypothetical protein
MRRIFSRRGASLEVEADDATMAWLVARTAPYGFSEADKDPTWRIVADAAHRGNGNWARYNRQYASGETCAFLVDTERRVIAIDAPDADWRKLYALRMMRNVLRWQLLRLGALFMHGSCVSSAGRGLCLIGPSRTGKTSLTLSALQSGRWDYVTEDDATIQRDDEGCVILGWPGSLRIRRSMLIHFPEIADAVTWLKHPANPLEEKLDPNVAVLRVFPDELAAIYGCQVVGETRLSLWGVACWAQAEAIHPLETAILARAIERAWDVLPERRAGAPSLSSDEQDWNARVFDPFLLKHYGAPPVSEYMELLSSWTRETRGFLLCHTGRMAPRLWGSLLERGTGGAGSR